MTKSFFKELIIVLLLCLAIILLIGILLYEYVPTTKTLPNPVSYVTSDQVKQELTESTIDESQVILTYEIDANDLNNFKRVQNYKPGKANPFSSYEVNSSSGTQPEQSGSGNTGNTASSGTTTNNTTTSGGTFFKDKGTK